MRMTFALLVMLCLALPTLEAEEPNPEIIQQQLTATQNQGDPARGLMVFAAAKHACLNCHKVGEHGGDIGPALTKVAKDRKPEEIVASVLWPSAKVDPKYQAHSLITEDGRVLRGYILKEDAEQLLFVDPTRPDNQVTLKTSEIEARKPVGSLMPNNLTDAMSQQQLADLFAFLMQLGNDKSEADLTLAKIDQVLQHTHAHLHGPVTFEFDRSPLNVAASPYWEHNVNRNRIYDFYAKEAIHFRELVRAGMPVPPLLMEFPGLDGGTLGHWGNQNEQTWASDAWNDVKLGRLQAGIFRGQRLDTTGKTHNVQVTRGMCVQLGDDKQLHCCFNPDSLKYEAVWAGEFLSFSSVRHGFMHGVTMGGKPVPFELVGAEAKSAKYNGLYRIGDRVVFSYQVGDVEYWDAPWSEDGKFVREVAPRAEHSLAQSIQQAPQQWPQTFETKITHGSESPYAVDTIEMPFDNPWNVPLFGGGVGFDESGDAYVCTMHGDVWKVTGLAYPSTTATWKRFASGLHHCQGMIVDETGIYVLGRDQITELRDLNHNDEADAYRCFSKAYQTSPAGHDFICGLERDGNGYFYLSSGNQGIVRVSPDGQHAEVVATGFRNPDGIGRTADGYITVPCSEGSWTPATMICAFRPEEAQSGPAPHFGYPGPRDGKTPRLPLVYLPRGMDNSAGGQQVVKSDKWGPLEDKLLHFSFGAGQHFLVLQDEGVPADAKQPQGAIVPLPGDFQSGVHRGSFNPVDGQLYVTGMQGWGSYTPETGCFERVRYTGAPVQLPIGYRVYKNGVLIEFSEPVEDVADEAKNHFAQCWNYRYSSAYGSPEFSTQHFGVRGHDYLPITSAHVINNSSVFLEIPDLQPANQVHLHLQVGKEAERDLLLTVHNLPEESFTAAPGLKPLDHKEIAPHPIHLDLAMALKKVPNPHAKRKKGGRQMTIETASNLSYATRSFTVKAGELVEFKLKNPDVVPHNWVLVQPGKLQEVGELSNHLISDPEAAVNQYIPKSDTVIAYTDIVSPQDEFIIYFNAPKEPGRYPYLCTFPGHWLVMNGEMIVE